MSSEVSAKQRADAGAQADPFAALRGARVLITGGTGNVGAELLRQILAFDPEVVRIFSRDEAKQFEMQQRLGPRARVRYLLGDVRDLERLRMAFQDVDIVFHCAGLKHVMACEYNPFEAVKTNVVGTQNVIRAALEEEVGRVLLCSTDKAVNPANAMGASKLMAERLMTAANSLKGGRHTVFATTRFGNVVGTRGSALPIFRRQILQGGPVTLTSSRMTRFVMTLPEAGRLVLRAACLAQGGEIFVPRLPALRIADLATVMIEELGEGRPISVEEIGARPGEQYYEALMSGEERDRAVELGEFYVVLPDIQPLAGDASWTLPELQRPEADRCDSRTAPLLDREQVRAYLHRHALLEGHSGAA